MLLKKAVISHRVLSSPLESVAKLKSSVTVIIVTCGSTLPLSELWFPLVSHDGDFCPKQRVLKPDGWHILEHRVHGSQLSSPPLYQGVPTLRSTVVSVCLLLY